MDIVKTYAVTDTDLRSIAKRLNGTSRILALFVIRTVTGVGLKEAKEYLADTLTSKQGVEL